MNRIIFTTLAALTAALLAAAPAPASEPSPLLDAYGGPGGQVLTDTVGDLIPPPANLQDADDGGATSRGPSVQEAAVPVERGAPPAAAPPGDLPFTGFETAVVLAAGLTLLAAGLLARRAARRV